MLNGHDRYSWLLAKLVAETARTFATTSLRENLRWLHPQLDQSGKRAIERYLRQAYQACKTQAWPSQRCGIERLAKDDSFVLCTPTGSGKTTVAEIAILQRLFSPAYAEAAEHIAPLVMYLVPKRALAAEVEAKLLRTIAPLSDSRVVITGLYGGIDWGPTDAWLTADEKTVLICTYEKAEALIQLVDDGVVHLILVTSTLRPKKPVTAVGERPMTESVCSAITGSDAYQSSNRPKSRTGIPRKM